MDHTFTSLATLTRLRTATCKPRIHDLRHSLAVDTLIDWYRNNPNGDDEGRALLREAFTLSGDLQIIGDTLHIRLDPASAPRRSRAIAALCNELNDTKTLYPSSALTLHYSVKGYPALA